CLRHRRARAAAQARSGDAPRDPGPRRSGPRRSAERLRRRRHGPDAAILDPRPGERAGQREVRSEPRGARRAERRGHSDSVPATCHACRGCLTVGRATAGDGMSWHRRSAAALFVAALLSSCATAPSGLDYRVPDAALRAPEAASGYTEKPGWWAHKFMVAAANPLATDAGYQVLKAGGTAVDAAIAVQMVLGLVEPQSSGVGGGLFLVHYDGKTVQAFDGRETAPAAATPELFMKDGKPMGFMEGVVGGRSVGVPGTLRALELAHQQHGKLPWKALFQPAIQLAEKGFALSPRL